MIIDAAKAKSDVQRNARNDVKEEADKINNLIENQNEELTRIYDNKDKKREAYYKQLFEFEEQQEMMAHLKLLYA